MYVSAYRLRVLDIADFENPIDIATAQQIIRAWRNKAAFETACAQCNSLLLHNDRCNFKICCNSLYFNPTDRYLVKSLAVRTPRMHLLPVYLRSKLEKEQIRQDFLVLPDPIYWQLETTLVYDSVLNFLANPLQSKPIAGRKRAGSFFEKHGELDGKLAKAYLRVQNAPLYHCSLSYRTQGKESLYRKITIPKRAERTARAMIVPAPHLPPNQVVLPKQMSDVLGTWVMVNRMPSLSPENFVGLFVSEVWDSCCIGLPGEVWKHLNADFDGDETNVLFLSSEAAQAECRYLLNSRENMYSFSHGIKLYPTQDALVAYYLSPPPLQQLQQLQQQQQQRRRWPSLIEFLNVVFETEGSSSCFEWCDYFRRHYLDVLENEVCFAVCFEEFERMRRLAKRGDSFEDFLRAVKSSDHQREEEQCLEIQIKSGAKGSYYHLYQLVGSIGMQQIDDDAAIESSFLDGLTPEEYITHAKSGHTGLIESNIGVWKPGYSYFKLANNASNIIVDYRGRLLDGEQVLSRDALEETFYEDVMSQQTFQFLFDHHFGG